MTEDQAVAIALGTLIRHAAEEQQMPLVKLARAAGMPRASLYRYLDGERDMPLSALTAIAGALNVAPDALLHGAIEAARRDAREG